LFPLLGKLDILPGDLLPRFVTLQFETAALS
jgi:hypothetical protein